MPKTVHLSESLVLRLEALRNYYVDRLAFETMPAGSRAVRNMTLEELIEFAARVVLGSNVPPIPHGFTPIPRGFTAQGAQQNRKWKQRAMRETSTKKS